MLNEMGETYMSHSTVMLVCLATGQSPKLEVVVINDQRFEVVIREFMLLSLLS